MHSFRDDTFHNKNKQKAVGRQISGFELLTRGCDQRSDSLGGE